MNQPDPQSRSFERVMSSIQFGTLKIPQFQREFVWPREKSAKLIDSSPILANFMPSGWSRKSVALRVWEDDYDRFFRERCKSIARKLRASIPKRPIDAGGVRPRDEDYDPNDLSPGDDLGAEK